MKITRVLATTHNVPVPVPLLEEPVMRPLVFCSIETDTGISGYGISGPIQRNAVREHINTEMGPMILGSDPFNTERIWHQLYVEHNPRSQTGTWSSAISAIDIALWDIKGKATNLPVWKLLGGSVRQRVRVYTGIGGNTPEQCVESAEKAVEAGFSAVKMGISTQPVRFVDTPKSIDMMVARVVAVREAIGNQVDIAVDFHRRLSPTMAAILIKELEPLRLLFVEEPCHPENNQPLLKLSESTTIPIAETFLPL